MSFWIAVACFLVGLGWCIANALALTDGQFTLAMDDPYIHLALAENIARGTYGINLDEFSSPASSILWPFLLVPFAALGVGDSAALVWNTLSTLLVLWMVARVLWPGTSDLGPLGGVVRVVVLAAVPFVLNLFAMAMLGMEHGPHIAVSLCVIVGTHRLLSDGRLPRWLPATVVAAGLLRYETLALSFCVLTVMFAVGHRQAAVMTALILIAIVGGFSLYLHARSDYWVPVSVLSKDGPVASGLEVARTMAQFARNQASPEGRMLCVGAAWMAFVSLASISLTRNWRLGWMVPVLGASVTAHLFLGRMDWFHRYELYLWAMLLVTTLLFVTSVHAPALRVVGLLGTIVLWTWQSWPYVRDLREVPVASQDTYQQQFQMHRFAVDYWSGPVAINDLGWVAYQNDAYVLDLWQLGSVASYRARIGRDVRAWEDLVPQHQVQLAMIYAHWFTEQQPMALPATWIRIGSLEMSHEPVIANARAVQFFATDPGAEAAIRAAVERWRPTLPSGVTFHRRRRR